MSDDLNQQWREAIATAKESGRAMMPRLVEAEGISLDPKGRAEKCPWCDKKQTFHITRKNGRWFFGCHNDTCEAHASSGDEIKFLQLRRGMDFKEASRTLLEIAGIEPPAPARKPQTQPQRETKPESGEPEEETEAPKLLRVPDLGVNPYEAAWLAMELTASHRAELAAKRGLPATWVDALGFRTAQPANSAKLAGLLDQFPPNVLLRAGLAQRDIRTNGLRVADSLLGRYHNEETDLWETRETIIIPYADEKGRIVLLRPHKKSLTNRTWREREAESASYEKLYNNLRIVFGEHLIAYDAPDPWKHTVVVCEGEYKAIALRVCGIPAIAFQGIHFFAQNSRYRQAINDTAAILRRHGYRKAIVVFDNEDKSHKDFHMRFEAETWARYTAECLEDEGFDAMWGSLPDDWREGGTDGTGAKADWDSRLAWNVRRSRTKADGIAKASAEFAKLLNNRGRKDSPIRKPQRQVPFIFDAKEDVINQSLHRLRHVPKLFKGGDPEIQLAAELQNHVPEEYAHLLRIPKLCEALRECYGGYFTAKAPTDKMQETCAKILAAATKKLGEAEELPGQDADTEKTIRGLRATITAAKTILYSYPKPFTDFTAESHFKVMVHLPDGGTRLDRLVVFRDSNGVRSKPCQLSSELMRSAQELRRFFLAMGDYHWSGGQNECDMWCHDIDHRNYQKVIEEIDTYGWNKEGRFYLLGDCAVLEGDKFKFADPNGITWIKDTGYRNSDNMAGFTCKPPSLFPGVKNPKAAFEAMDWDAERGEVERIWRSTLADYYESFGGFSGLALVAGVLQYLAHPEIHREIGFKPGMMVQGEKGSGKTKSIEFAMGLIGFPRDYGYISLGSTKIGVERSLSQFWNLPVHIDEYRNTLADDKLLDLLRCAINEMSTAKGTPNGNKAVRKSTPLNVPIVSGEDGFTDSATRSRYFRIVASKAYGHEPKEDESEEDRTKRNTLEAIKRDNRFDRMMRASEQYFRVGRYLFKNRSTFASLAIKYIKEFTTDQSARERINDSRARQVSGVFYGSLLAAWETIAGSLPSASEIVKIKSWFISNGSETSEDTEKDVFRRQFFRDCITMIELNEPGVNKLIRVRPGNLVEGGKVALCSEINPDRAKLFILIAGNGLYDQYLAYKRKRGQAAPIAKQNLLAELRTQPAWITPPKNAASRQHRFAIPGEQGSMNTWWVLDYRKLEPELREIFDIVWERELAAFNMTPNPDGSVDHPEIQF